MNRHCIPGLICPQPDGELLCERCQGIIKTMLQGLARTRIALYLTPREIALKKPDVMI